MQFLQKAKERNVLQTFNYLNADIYKALHNPATLTMLTVLVLYIQLITNSCMSKVEVQGLEQVHLLELGPMHKWVKEHVHVINKEPDCLLVSWASSETSTQWRCIAEPLSCLCSHGTITQASRPWACPVEAPQRHIRKVEAIHNQTL